MSFGLSNNVLHVSAAVTQVCWRPPSNELLPTSSDSINNSTSHTRDGPQEEILVDRHDSMLAVTTARLTSAGGSGALSLWSFHRPYMSLSIVEGHKEGAISDFVWLQTPLEDPSCNPSQNTESSTIVDASSLDALERTRNDIDEFATSSEPLSVLPCIWQHVLSVGRDGQCIMQSFVRGERRIRRVPTSCFAMANLSPFQSGYGSLVRAFFVVFPLVLVLLFSCGFE